MFNIKTLKSQLYCILHSYQYTTKHKSQIKTKTAIVPELTHMICWVTTVCYKQTKKMQCIFSS